MDKPKKFLESRISVENADVRFSCLCAGFELKKWRFERLAAHLTDWLPEFATRHDDLPTTIGNISDYRNLIERAAERVYTTGKTKRRGEIGEILLHAICREFFETFPTVSKVYYKTASNDVVKGFDLVHTRFFEKEDEIELWLGESKFYKSGSAAVSAAILSISEHLEAGFLKSEKLLLGGKISGDTPGYSKLEWLFEKDTPIDKIFDRLVIPVLIAYDSACTCDFDDDAVYNTELIKEVDEFQTAFKDKLPKTISVVCLYLPMDSKTKLVEAFDKKLKAHQA